MDMLDKAKLQAQELKTKLEADGVHVVPDPAATVVPA